MKKLLLIAVAFAVLGLSSCKKEDSAVPQIKNNKVAAKDLGSYD